MPSPRARAGSGTPTCSIPGSARGLFPLRRSGGPRRRPSSGPSTRPTPSSPGRDIIFLWVARMVMLGIEFTGQIPFRTSTSTRSSRLRTGGGCPSRSAPGRPAGPDRRRPAAAGVCRGARRLPGVRRRRGALGPVRDVLRPGRALQRGQARQGLQLTNKLWNAARLILLGWCVDPDRAAVAQPRAGRRIAGSSRGWSARADRRGRDRALRLLPRGARLYDFIYAELCDWYLGARQAAPARGEQAAAGNAAPRAHPDAGARPSDDPVRDRGDLSATSPAPRACSPPACRRRRGGSTSRRSARSSA